MLIRLTLPSSSRLTSRVLADTPVRNTVVIAGSGFSGIETATEGPARLRVILGATANVNVIVVGQVDEIGPDLGPGPRPVIKQVLEKLGVTWRVSAAGTPIDADGLWTSTGERIEAETVI